VHPPPFWVGASARLGTRAHNTTRASQIAPTRLPAIALRRNQPNRASQFLPPATIHAPALAGHARAVVKRRRNHVRQNRCETRCRIAMNRSNRVPSISAALGSGTAVLNGIGLSAGYRTDRQRQSNRRRRDHHDKQRRATYWYENLGPPDMFVISDNLADLLGYAPPYKTSGNPEHCRKKQDRRGLRHYGPCRGRRDAEIVDQGAAEAQTVTPN
jgi:hypothetical protein